MIGNWPHARAFIEQTLDGRMIERHAEALLARALNTRRVIAFVGSGVSAAYGRATWGELVRLAKHEVMERYEQLKGSKKVHLPTSLSRLKETIDTLDIERDFAADRLPMIFQVCEQLDRELAHFIARAASPNPKQPSSTRLQWRPLDTKFRERIKTLAFDDRASALMILEEAIGQRHSKSNFRRFWRRDVFVARTRHSLRGDPAAKRKGLWDLLGLTDEPAVLERRLQRHDSPRTTDRLNRNAQFRVAFQCGALYTLLNEAPEQGAPELAALVKNAADIAYDEKHKQFLDALDERQTNPEATLPGAWLAPTHRMLVGLAISALAPSQRLRRVRDACALVPHLRPKRSQIVDDAFDPLALLHDQLNIRRFLTTNFDLEIERLWRDRGYAVKAPNEDDKVSGPIEFARSVATHPLGMAAEDLVIGPESGANLIDFAVRDQPVGRMLAHMHGRAVDNEAIVVTEADYQNLYLSDGPERDVLNGAIRLAFGANPLLFVGLGMNEDDVLRPLRHFVSEVQRQHGRVAVALLPQLTTSAKTAEQKVALLGRFGVYAIHYGGARFGEGPNARADDTWLAKTMMLLEGLQAFTKEMEKAICADKSDMPLPDLAQREALWDWESLEPTSDEVKKKLPRPLQHPTFWSARYHAERAKIGASLEITLLNGLIAYLSAPDGEFRAMAQKARELPDDARKDALVVDICRAIGRACVGLRSAIQHRMLCEALRDLKLSWAKWRDEWFQPPAHRTASFPALSSGRGPRDIEIRYHGYPPLLMKPPDREPTAYPAMADLLSALNTAGSVPGLGTDGRILYIASPRGSGRGALFTGVCERKGLEALLDAWWGAHHALGEAASGEGYRAALLYNLSFSNEVGSTFDAIATRLWRECASLIKDAQNDPRLSAHVKTEISEWDKAFERQRDELENARIERLKVGVAHWAKIARAYQMPPRLLIVLNGVDMLFDSSGRAKNGQIERLMDALLSGPMGEGCPLDLILMANSRVAPHFFQTAARRRSLPWGPGEEPSGIALRPLFRPRSTDSERVNAQQALAQAGFHISDDPCSRHLVVLQRHPQVIELAQIFYPEMLASLAFSLLMKPAAEPQTLTAAQRASLADEIKNVNGHELIAGEGGLASLASQLALKFVMIVAQVEKAEQVTQVHNDVAKQLDSVFKDLWVLTGRNRFAATLHLSVWAEQEAHRFLDQSGVSGADFAAAIRSNLRELGAKFEAVGNARGDAVIAEAMHSYARLQRLGRLSPLVDRADQNEEAVFGLRGNYADAISPKKWLAEERQSFFEFQELILWHLAVIGQPTDIRTLAECPEIREYCAFLLPPHHKGAILKAASAQTGDGVVTGETLPDDLVEDILRVALRLMTTRALVFRVHGRTVKEIAVDAQVDKGSGGEEVGRASRFSLHRTVQRYVLRRLNAPLSEQHERDHYVPSVYATQIDEEPRLHFDAHRRVRKLLSALTRYPSGARLAYEKRPPLVEAGCIGAAFGLVRTIYSLAIIAKFSAFEEDGRLPTPSHGFFEDHRLQMRWLLEAARRVGLQLQDPSFGPSPSPPGALAIDAHGHRRAPLYPEEIVWLYNEIGVLSMICGQLHDSLGMLRKAEEVANTRIEGASRYRPLCNRIGLNIAIVDIERGRIADARVRLSQIAEIERQRPVVHAIATGYLGLCEHLGGRLDVAETHYKTAITKLTVQVDRSRAASIFYRHLADLRRARGDEPGARDHIGMAVNLAARGGHEDIRHMARLAQARIDVAFARPERGTALQRELDSIQHYAKLMGMQRLMCDVSLMRAEILLRQGESRLSSDLALAALSIATTNGLNLKKVDAMLALAKCYLDRGRLNAGRILLRQAADAARSFGLQRALLVAETTFAAS
jgi:hypothetical protein